MTAGTIRFSVESEDAGRAVLRALREHAARADDSRRRVQATYHDTFDWRLYRDRGTLAAERVGDDWRLSWASIGGGIRQCVRVPAVPAFASDLRDASFREAVARVIKHRRLLPVVTVDVQRRSLRLLDDAGNIVTVASLEHGVAGDPDGPSSGRRPLAPILTLTPGNGAHDAHEAIVHLVERDLALPRSTSGALARALTAIGREPGEYSSKIDLVLVPDMRTNEAVRQVLAALMTTMCANETGIREDLDCEFLHDFRVAVRRTRTCLGELGEVFPPEAVARFRTEFSWLGKVTGPARDFDVHLIDLGAFRDGASTTAGRDLDPLARWLHERRRDEQRRLSDTLLSDRYRTLVTGWREFLTHTTPDPNAPPANALPLAEQAVGDVASQRIRARFDRVIKRGSKIQPGSRAEKLHRLRIECKRLRYLLEFFRSLYAGVELEYLIGVLKGLQDTLGALNDVRVHREALHRCVRERTDDHGVASQAALTPWVERLERRREKERERFDARFAAFADDETHACVACMLRPQASGPSEEPDPG